MSSKDSQLIFEAYLNNNNINKDTIQTLIEMRDYDIQCINELLQEAGWFDKVKQLGSQAVGAVKTAGNFVGNVIKNGNTAVAQAVQQGARTAATAVNKGFAKVTQSVIQSLVNTLVSKIAPDQQKAFIDLITGKMALPATQAQTIAKQVANTTVKESIHDKQSYKQWLANTLFTHENIQQALIDSNILTEASNSTALNSIAKEMAAKIQALYPKNKKAMAAALPKVTAGIHKALGVPQQAAIAMAAADATSTASATQAGTSTNTAAAAPTATTAAPTQGLLQQIIKLAVSYPKMSAVTAAGILGITVAAFASVGVVPMLLSCLSKAAFAGGTGAIASVIKQAASGQGVSGKQVAKDAAIGGAIGATTTILGTGLQSLGHAFAGMFGASNTPATANSNNNSASTGNHLANDMQYKQAIAKELGLTHGEEIVLKQGVPYDAQGHKLNISDATLDKLAAKYHQGAVMTPSAIQAAQARGRVPVKPGSIHDF